MATTYDYKVGTVVALLTDTYYTIGNRQYRAELRITITEIIDDYNFKAGIELYAFVDGTSFTSTSGIIYGYCRLLSNGQSSFDDAVRTNTKTYNSGYTFKRTIATAQTINISNGLYPNSNVFEFYASVYKATAYNCTTSQEIIFKKSSNPIYFNGTQINKVYFNGTEVTGDVYFNGTKIT